MSAATRALISTTSTVSHRAGQDRNGRSNTEESHSHAAPTQLALSWHLLSLANCSSVRHRNSHSSAMAGAGEPWTWTFPEELCTKDELGETYVNNFGTPLSPLTCTPPLQARRTGGSTGIVRPVNAVAQQQQRRHMSPTLSGSRWCYVTPGTLTHRVVNLKRGRMLPSCLELQP